MMTMCFSVFDTKAAVFGTPFFMPREAMAIRSFEDLTNDGKSLVFNHPEDFSLYHVGDFDDDSGEMVPVKPRNLVTAASLLKPSVGSGIKLIGKNMVEVEK